MYDYSDDLSNYTGNGWPTIEDDCFYGNQENLQEKVEFTDAQEDNSNSLNFWHHSLVPLLYNCVSYVSVT